MDQAKLERELRHQQAAAVSDYQHLLQCLSAAADRFADLADIITRDPKYDAASFLRASAERYRAEVEAHSR